MATGSVAFVASAAADGRGSREAGRPDHRDLGSPQHREPERLDAAEAVFAAEGDEARWLGREPLAVRRQAVVDSLVRYFGPKAGTPELYLERDWQQEKWSGGCYGALFGPNVWTRYGRALRERIGPIHWAGTETATVWTGYMEGAIRSGADAAQALLASLA